MVSPSRRLGLNSHKPKKKILKWNGHIRAKETEDNRYEKKNHWEITNRQVPVVMVQKCDTFIQILDSRHTLIRKCKKNSYTRKDTGTQ